MPFLPDDIQLRAAAPSPVIGSSTQVSGPLGLRTFYYWWVSHFPIGVIVVSDPIPVFNAPAVLGLTNFVTVTGQPSPGALSYDLLRTDSPRLPSVTGNIALAIGLTSPTFNDQGQALTAYNIAGLAAGAPVSEFISLNNRDHSTPLLVFSPWPLGVPALVFPDGSTQSTAAVPIPASVPSWKTYTVVLVPPNWQVTSSDGTVTIVPTAAAPFQDIPIGTFPPNSYLTFARIQVTAGPNGGVSAVVTGIQRSPGDTSVLPVGINLGINSGDNLNSFADNLISSPFTPGNSIINTQQTLTAKVTATNVNNITPPCAFAIHLLWGVLS